jgi:ketosteroid isomerase-like protein
MKTMIRFAGVLLFCATAAFSQTQTAPDQAVQAKLVSLEKMWFDAGSTANADRMSALMADDFMALTPGGSVIDKQGLLPTSENPSRLPKLQLRDEKIQMYGDTAVIMGSLVSADTGGPAFLSTCVFQKRGEKWLLVAVQLSPMKI